MRDLYSMTEADAGAWDRASALEPDVDVPDWFDLLEGEDPPAWSGWAGPGGACPECDDFGRVEVPCLTCGLGVAEVPDPDEAVVRAAVWALHAGCRPWQVVAELANHAGLVLSDRYMTGFDRGYEAAQADAALSFLRPSS